MGQLLVVLHVTPVGFTCLRVVKQLELIPGLLAGLFLLSPGAPVNNCRWASIQWTWDQWNGFATVPVAGHWSKPLWSRTWIRSPGRKLQASSRKLQAASLTKQDSGIIKDI